jgi:hypothetical protein
VSDSSQGFGWWLASDGKWYPPELHPFVPVSQPGFGVPVVPVASVASGGPWASPQQQVAGYQATPFLTAGPPSYFGQPEQKRTSRARPAAIALGVVGALVLLAVAAPFAGHVIGELTDHAAPPADQIPITSTPPISLGGQQLSPQALGENAPWSSTAAQIAKDSTVSFGGVYGAYPPQQLPTVQTFMVIAAEPTGGVGDIPNAMSQAMNGIQSVTTKYPGAQITRLPAAPSVLDGQIECVSVTLPNGDVGECVWMNESDFVELVTFSGDLQTVSGLTQQVITELHDHSVAT